MKNAFVFFLIVLAGCTFNNSRTNMPGDNQNAISCCKAFENFRKEGRNSSAVKMISSEINAEKLYGVFNKVDSVFGKLISYEAGTVSSNVESNNGIEAGAYAVDFN